MNTNLLENKLNNFLGKSTKEELENEDKNVIRSKKDKSIIERVNKVILTEDNRQLLM